MKKIYSLVLLVAGVFSWGSCSLDEVNPNNSGQFSDGSYTLETYKAFTNSCYTALINNIYQSSDYLVCTEAGTDIWEEPKSGSSYQRYHSYNGMKTDDSYYYKVWQYSYLCINSCNIVIDGAENVTGDENEINECVAQARCLRAYYYMNLVEQFGNVDLQLKAADSENISFDAHRSTVPEIYAAIIEDLKFAVENLPVSFSDYYSRVTKKSAMGLLARAYINGAGYDLKDTDGVSFLEKAYDTATTMINNKAIYEWYMHPAFADVFNENNNRNNEEALFIAAGAERNSDAYTNGNYSQSEMFRHFLPSLGTYTDLGLVDKTSNFVYGRPNSNIFLPSKYLMDCFAADMNDSRFRYSFISAYSSYSIPAWGATYEYGGSACAKEITSTLATKFGIPASNIGKKVYPHFNLHNRRNRYPALQGLYSPEMAHQRFIHQSTEFLRVFVQQTCTFGESNSRRTVSAFVNGMAGSLVRKQVYMYILVYSIFQQVNDIPMISNGYRFLAVHRLMRQRECFGNRIRDMPYPTLPMPGFNT
mgnify:CR=1 FL=1